MKPRRFAEIIQAETEDESHQDETCPGEAERQPEDKKIIEVGGDEPVQGRHFKKDEHLHQDEQYEPDSIFQQLAHCTFLRVESSKRFCSSSCKLSTTYTYSIL